MKGIIKAGIIAANFLIMAYGSAEQYTLEIQDLKDLKLLTKQVESVGVYPGRPTLGEVTEVPGRAYAIRSPLTAQQVFFMHPVGTALKAGEDFVKLIGPEVHHYYSQFQVKKSLFELAEQQYKRNKPLYAQSAISQQAWLDINHSYFTAKLDYDEMQHFFELVSGFDEQSETLTLKSPINGVLRFNNLESLAEENMLARVVPTDSIKLTFNITNKDAKNLAFLSIPATDCKLQISAIESVASGLSTKAWSEALTTACPYTLGQNISVTPYFSQQAYSIPRQSVFSMGGEQFVFVKSVAQFTAVKVLLTSSVEQNYIVTSEASLVNKEILTSSVSAAQGVLLGLGSE